MDVLRAYTRHLSLIVGPFDEYRRHCGQQPDPEAARVFLAERLERRDSVIFFASEGSGSFERALGFVQIYPGWSSLWMKRVWTLGDLYVEPSSRRRGIARALHERVRQHALETKANRVVACTAILDEAVLGLGRALGYRVEQNTCHLVLDPGDWSG
ncbi:MAG TPA: GNAT family N-acetyltransferase [Bryobacteraceae bacterium]|nr:GNAT family N-acetyltransferase [Bryobacteraceae bacterium]